MQADCLANQRKEERKKQREKLQHESREIKKMTWEHVEQTGSEVVVRKLFKELYSRTVFRGVFHLFSP